VIFISAKIAESQMHHSRRRRTCHDAIREIGVLADNDQIVFTGEFPNLSITGYGQPQTRELWEVLAKIAGATEHFHRINNLSCRLHHGIMITHEAGSIIEAGLDIRASEFWIFFQHVLDRIAGGKEFQNRLHRDARAANHGAAIADIRLDRNAP
jgi:hypothetical protein